MGRVLWLNHFILGWGFRASNPLSNPLRIWGCWGSNYHYCIRGFVLLVLSSRFHSFLAFVHVCAPANYEHSPCIRRASMIASTLVCTSRFVGLQVLLSCSQCRELKRLQWFWHHPSRWFRCFTRLQAAPWDPQGCSGCTRGGGIWIFKRIRRGWKAFCWIWSDRCCQGPPRQLQV